MREIALTPINLVGVTVGMHQGLIDTACLIHEGERQGALAVSNETLVPTLYDTDGQSLSVYRLSKLYEEDPEKLADTQLQIPDDSPLDEWITHQGEANLDAHMPEEEWELSPEDRAELEEASRQYHQLCQRLRVPFMAVVCPMRTTEGVEITTSVMTGSHVNRVDDVIPRVKQAVEATRDPYSAIRKMMAEQGLADEVPQ